MAVIPRTKQQDLPIGLQSFESLRRANFLYVDKTEFIDRLLHGRYYFLSRPRRFGKSLFLSTLKAYFLAQKELFEGLYIGEREETLATEQGREAWITFPVLHLDLNAKNYVSRKSLLEILDFHLSDWEEKYSIARKEETPEDRFKILLKTIYETTHQQVVILIDEYDKPLLETIEPKDAELNEEYRKILKGFYGVLKNCDQYIRLAFLTGVTKFGKISIFSDLNNLNDISLHTKYATICGITEDELREYFDPEIKALAQEKNTTVEATLQRLKLQYDGYKFAANAQSIYNPFSLLKAFDANDFDDYWFYSGTPTFLIKYLQAEHFFIPDLDNNNVLIGKRMLENMRAAPSQLVSIFYQSGYLTIKDYDEEKELFRLGFPNNEVRYAFLEVLYPAYVNLKREINCDLADFNAEIDAGKVDAFMTRIKSIIAGIPYSTFSKEDRKWREEYYQSIVAVIFQMLGRLIQTEVHCATGRVDAIVHTANIIYIFEFKLWSRGSSRDAIKQIKKQGYADKFLSSRKQIMLIGASFDSWRRNLKTWKTEVL